MILAVWLTAQGMSQSRPSIPHGLSRAEAARLLKLHGPNELPDKSRRNLLRIVRDVFAEPMFALLLAGGVIYFMLGEPLDAFILLAFATFSVSIGVVQEARSERVLAALRSIAAPRALVVRDGETLRVPAREVVPGDFVLLSEGDRIPADGVLVEAHGLQVDESLLTGESVPVQKVAPGLADATPAEAAMIYAGTLAVRGSGSAVISATGVRSEMGRIGLSLQNITLEEPGLKEQLRWLVRDAAIFGVAVAVLVVLASGFLRHSWLEAALGGVAIGMSVMPEEIPLVLAVFMAMGAWRLSRAHILTRRASAIETLGSATVLCTDKTGTLTENRMRVELLVQGGNTWRRSDTEPAPSPSLDRIVTGAVAASAPRPTDPMDRAVHAIAGEHAAGSDVLLHTYPLTAELLAFTNIWKHAASGDVFAAAKGAPEAIAGLCHLSPDEHAKLTATVDAFAREGIRLLAVADARLPGESSPATPHDIPFAFVGLVGFIDPVRASVPDAVRQCREAGVRVAMITGDYPATAVAIAGQAGIASDSVLTGAELEALDDVALAERIRAVGVFARIRPHQKLRIVEALKRDGEVVAMTGDGINDAPAIKAAHIGIAMGARGTDVAREAAALVLLDDEFSSIVAAIRLGRRIYDNLRKAIQYIVAVHIPIAGLALLPILFGMPLMLLPVQIALLEMLIDPACSIVFETEGEEANVMRRPPRDPKAPVLPHSTLIWAAIQGAASLAVVTLALVIGVAAKIPEDDLRALVFTVLVLMNIGLILVNRAQSSSLRDAFLRANPALWILSGLVLVLLALALYWPPLRGLFHFGHLHLDDVSACVAVGLVFVLALETLKRWLRLQ